MHFKKKKKTLFRYQVKFQNDGFLQCILFYLDVAVGHFCRKLVFLKPREVFFFPVHINSFTYDKFVFLQLRVWLDFTTSPQQSERPSLVSTVSVFRARQWELADLTSQHSHKIWSLGQDSGSWLIWLHNIPTTELKMFVTAWHLKKFGDMMLLRFPKAKLYQKIIVFFF